MALQQTAELNTALQAAADRRASDLFLLPNEPVAFRVDGQIVRAEGPPLTPAATWAIARAAIGEESLAGVGSRTGRAVTACSLPGVVDGQLCVARTMGNYAVMVRLFPRHVLTPQDIGLPAEVLAALSAPHGLILFTGVFGSGVTTTAFACLEHLNATRPIHICTVEDPLVVMLNPKRALVTQREIGTDAPDVPAAIAAAMQQDLDVLFVTDVRTPADLDACLTVARTGHLVLLQLHLATAPKAIERFLDVFAPDDRPAIRRTLAQELVCVCAQRLLRRADAPSRVIPAYSVLIPDEPFRRALAGDTGDTAIADLPTPPGFHDLRDAIASLRDQGKVNPEEAANAQAST